MARRARTGDSHLAALGSSLSAVTVAANFDLRHQNISGEFRIRSSMTSFASRITGRVCSMIEMRLRHERLRQFHRRDFPYWLSARAFASHGMTIRTHSSLEDISRDLIRTLLCGPEHTSARRSA